MKKEFECVMTIVSRGQGDLVIDATKRAGAQGGTIITGRGTGAKESRRILGLFIEPEKEIVLTVVPVSIREKVLKTVRDTLELETPGKGITFVLPVEDVIGIAELDEEMNEKSDK